MDFDCELNLTEICRCCKRMEPGMTSIFKESAHPTDSTYPSVQDMLRSIASLNVQENDGLPSLICTLCLNNIQDAFSFILQIILVDSELSQLLHARGQHADILPQSFYYNTNEYISTEESVKEENESAPIEAGATFIENICSSEPYLESYEDIKESNFLTPVEDNTNDTANIENDLIHLDAGDIVEEEKESSPAISMILQEPQYLEKMKQHNTCTGNDNDDLLKVQGTKNMDHDNGAEGDYKEDDEDGTSADSSEADPNLAVADVYVADDVEMENIRPKSRSKRGEKTSKPTIVYKCKLCTSTNTFMSNFKRHLLSHFKDKPFACSKCDGTFARKYNMLSHDRRCNGTMRHRNHASKPVISLTLQDLEDPLIMKQYYSKYYSKTDVEIQNKDDDDLNMHRAQNREDDVGVEDKNNADLARIFKCNLCGHTTSRKYNLKQHLLAHCKDKKLFACSKCNSKFTRRGHLQRHGQACNGVFRTSPKRSQLMLTRQDLENPLKLQMYYTETEIKVQQKKDAHVLKCKLCAYKGMCVRNLKRHLLTHCKDKKLFACSKCNSKFARREHLQRHWRTCNGVFRTSRKRSQQVLTRQELEDALKIQNYYTEP